MTEKREADKEVKVRLTADQLVALKAVKKRTGQTITAIVRNFVIDGLEREAEKHGLATSAGPEEQEDSGQHQSGGGTRRVEPA